MSYDPIIQNTIYDDDVIKSFKVAVAFKDRIAATNGMDWDRVGDVLITSSFDKTVYIYSVAKANVTNILQSKKHGVELVKFTNEGPKHILCSSSKDSPSAAVRLWDIVENRYLKSFPLNKPLMRGIGIVSHPSRNLMLTNSTCGTVCLYTHDNATPISSYSLSGTSVASFDHEGLIFAKYDGIDYNSKKLSLYDLSKLQTPFRTFDIAHVLKKFEDVVSLLFSPNGRYIILGTNFSRLICINSVNGNALFACCYGDIPAVRTITDQLCFPAISPDGKYLLSGCLDGSLRIWNFKGQLVNTLSGHEGQYKDEEMALEYLYQNRRANPRSLCPAFTPF